MSKRSLLAALGGAVAMFLWSFVAHMVLPLGEAGIKEIPGEQAVLSALHTALGDSAGLYFFPGMGTPPVSTEEYAKRLAANPSGLLVYRAPGEKPITPGQLGTEFATELAECLLVVFLLVQTSLVSFQSRLGFVTVAGLLAAISTNISYWNWYSFPVVYTAGYMTTQIVGFFLAGLVIAFLTKSR